MFLLLIPQCCNHCNSGTDVAPADAAEALAKGGSMEEAADGTAGGDGLFDAQRTEEME